MEYGNIGTYRVVKEGYPDTLLLMRLGDFYEAFDKDAVTVARELDVLLTSVPDGSGRAPMAGMPWKMADEYTGRLVDKGYTVARLEPMEKKI
jgi:DNA mismatch repair protein MutS